MRSCRALIAVLFGVVAAPGFAQEPAPSARAGALRVFLDCNYACDETFLRQEITFIDYVRDRKDADVHVLVTTQSTGGGGAEFTLKFIGLDRFAGVEQTLKHVTPQTATSDEIRRGFAEVFKRGLVRYVSETPLAPNLKITFTAPQQATAQTDPKKDPWNLWVFRANFGGSFSGERSNRGRSIRGSASASRTTEDWKLSFTSSANYRENEFELSETETFKSVSKNVDGGGRVIKSVNENWSAGLIGSVSVSSFLNYDLRTRISPGIEYDFFPYSQSTRRMFTVQYTVGFSTFDYDQETIFQKLSENLADHRIITSLSMRQPWGSLYGDVSFSQFLTKPDKYNISAFGQADVRLFKGFSINGFTSLQRTRDQIYLPAGGATPEEILVRQRQLATGYRYSVSFGISYSFGSIFNNIVNPRFGGGGDFFFFF